MYDYYIKPEVKQKAIDLELIVEGGHVNRSVCTCKSKYWGAATHDKSCPVNRFYIYGGLYATDVLETLIKEHTK